MGLHERIAALEEARDAVDYLAGACTVVEMHEFVAAVAQWTAQATAAIRELAADLDDREGRR